MELRQANTNSGFTVCAACRQAILPFTDYWAGASADYHNGCKPEGAVLVLTLNDNVSVVSEGAA